MGYLSIKLRILIANPQLAILNEKRELLKSPIKSEASSRPGDI
jgi:hypothetical protein